MKSDFMHLLVSAVLWFCAAKDKALIIECLEASIATAKKTSCSLTVESLQDIVNEIEKKTS